jgi:hypothetical protein
MERKKNRTVLYMAAYDPGAGGGGAEPLIPLSMTTVDHVLLATNFCYGLLESVANGIENHQEMFIVENVDGVDHCRLNPAIVPLHLERIANDLRERGVFDAALTLVTIDGRGGTLQERVDRMNNHVNPTDEPIPTYTALNRARKIVGIIFSGIMHTNQPNGRTPFTPEMRKHVLVCANINNTGDFVNQCYMLREPYPILPKEPRARREAMAAGGGANEYAYFPFPSETELERAVNHMTSSGYVNVATIAALGTSITSILSLNPSLLTYAAEAAAASTPVATAVAAAPAAVGTVGLTTAITAFSTITAIGALGILVVNLISRNQLAQQIGQSTRSAVEKVGSKVKRVTEDIARGGKEASEKLAFHKSIRRATIILSSHSAHLLNSLRMRSVNETYHVYLHSSGLPFVPDLSQLLDTQEHTDFEDLQETLQELDPRTEVQVYDEDEDTPPSLFGTLVSQTREFVTNKLRRGQDGRRLNDEQDEVFGVVNLEELEAGRAEGAAEAGGAASQETLVDGDGRDTDVEGDGTDAERRGGRKRRTRKRVVRKRTHKKQKTQPKTKPKRKTRRI